MTKEKILNMMQERIDFNKEEQEDYEKGLKKALQEGNIREAIDYDKNVYGCKLINQVLYLLGHQIVNEINKESIEEKSKKPRIDIETLKDLLRYLLTCLGFKDTGIEEEIDNITLNENGWVDFYGMSFSLLEEVEE